MRMSQSGQVNLQWGCSTGMLDGAGNTIVCWGISLEDAAEAALGQLARHDILPEDARSVLAEAWASGDLIQVSNSRRPNATIAYSAAGRRYEGATAEALLDKLRFAGVIPARTSG